MTAPTAQQAVATDHRLLLGDAGQVLRGLPAGSVDLIMTSPPYALARKGSYGGVAPEQYVAWFRPIGEQLRRVLKPSGTFILNIKEGCVHGERSPYVLELILALREQGWRWTEEFIWHKKHCYPGRWPNRFRDGWERLLQFNRAGTFAMYQQTALVPAKANTVARSRTPCSRNGRVLSASGSGLQRPVVRSHGPQSQVLPDNVLHLAPETRNRGHSAAFPEALPAWFIRLFTQPGDLVLDPFMGSGTTNVAAKRLGRRSVGIDCQMAYVHRAAQRLATVKTLKGVS